MMTNQTIQIHFPLCNITRNQSMTCTPPHPYEPNPSTPYERSHNFHHKDFLPDTISVAVPKPYTLGFCRHNMGRFKQSMLSPLMIWHPCRRHSIHKHIVDVLRRVQPNTDWLGLLCKFQLNTISSKLCPVDLPYMFSACRFRTDANTMKSRLLFSSSYNIRCILFKRLPKQCRISRIYKWKAVWRCSSSINTILQGSGFSIYLRKSPTGVLAPHCPVNIPHEHHPSRTPLTSSTPLRYNKYSSLMHCIKIKSPAKFLLNEQYVFVDGNISFLCVPSCSSVVI